MPEPQSELLCTLQALHPAEEAVRTESLRSIRGDQALIDHLGTAHLALDHLDALLHVELDPGCDGHTAQLLAVRLFNVGAAASKLGLSGYYQQGFQLLRDSLELVNLVDWFRVERGLIHVWRTADNETLKKKFSASAVRRALEKHPDYTGQNDGRARVYALYSEHAAHPTYRGFHLLSPENVPRAGPFFEVGRLRAFLEDLAKHLAHATLGISSLIEPDDAALLEAKSVFLGALGVYHAKYIKRA